MTTIGELIQQVRDILDEPTAAQWTDAMFVRWINEGNRDLARSTRHIKDTTTVAGVGSVQSYTLDPEIIAVEHVYWQRSGDTRQYPLTPKHFENMDSVWGAYQSDESTDPNWFTVLGFSPNAEMQVFPVPANNGTFTLIVSRIPEELDPDSYTDSDTVEVPAAWYDALADYCEFKGLRRDRDDRWQEARSLYMEKRDGLISNADHMGINREMVPAPNGGYVDRWLVEPGYW